MAKYKDLTVGQMEAVVNKMGGMHILEAYLSDEYVLTKIAKAVTVALLVAVGTVSVAATTEKFVAVEKFVINTKADAGVKISYLSNDFKLWFLGKVEQSFAGSSELHIHKLIKSSIDTPMITELGGEAKAETTLTEMFSLMKKQGNGQVGDLLVNGYANIFYIRDVKGVLRAVDCYWDDRGWDVDAGPVGSPNEWGGGYRVFSRNSVAV